MPYLSDYIKLKKSMKTFKRLLLTLTLALIAVALVKAYINYPRFPDGYDLSHHNKKPDWSKLSRVQFVYLKATEGDSFKDSKFKLYSKTSKNHNLKVGAYHFMSPGISGLKQFNHFKSVVGKGMDLIPVLDIEVPDIADNDIREFVTECERYYGVKPMVYVNRYYQFKHRHATAGCKLWLSNKTRFQVFDDYDMWQYAIQEVGGMEVDHNCINPKHTIADFMLPVQPK